jgi:hypothetical protein
LPDVRLVEANNSIFQTKKRRVGLNRISIFFHRGRLRNKRQNLEIRGRGMSENEIGLFK